MVYVSTATLPAPAPARPRVFRPTNAVVCSRPMIAVYARGGGRNERRVAARTSSRHAAPSAVRMAEKVMAGL